MHVEFVLLGAGTNYAVAVERSASAAWFLAPCGSSRVIKMENLGDLTSPPSFLRKSAASLKKRLEKHALKPEQTP